MSAAAEGDIIPSIDVSISDPLERVQAFSAAGRKLARPVSFGDSLAGNLTLVAASATTAPHVTFTFTVTDALCNALHNLHGGAAALIFDVTTTCAVVPLSKKGFWEWAGVTRSLICTYLRALPEGTKVTVEAEVEHIGKRLVGVRGVMKDEMGRVAVTCDHTKISIDPEVGQAPPRVGGKL